MKLRIPRLLALAIASAFVAGCGNAPETGETTGAWRPIPVFIQLGGVDLDAYCKLNWSQAATPSLGSSTDPNSWKCKLGSSLFEVNFNNACIQQYGAPSFATSDAGNAFSWSCWSAGGPVDHCHAPDGSEYMDIVGVDPTGFNGAAGYEVIGESSPWQAHVRANAFSTPDSFDNLYLQASVDGKPVGEIMGDGDQPRVHDLVFEAGPVSSSSPTQHSYVLNTPCGPRTWQTRPLTRINPNKSFVMSIAASSTYVDSGTPVTLNVAAQRPPQPGTCARSSLVRVIGKQTYDDKVVVDLTFTGDEFLSRTLTVTPLSTTEYTATSYCVLDPSIRNTVKTTVTVPGPPLTPCPGNRPPPTFWFCRDCPYNTPPLTNTIVQTACTYDQAKQLAEQTTFGGACNLADGVCPTCPNPASCPPM